MAYCAQPRSRGLHALPALGDVPARSRSRKATRLSRLGILGQARAGLRRSARARTRHGAGSRGAWFESHRASVHRRRFRQFHVPGAARDWICQPAIATDRTDGMKLTDLYITAAVRCAPPDNKPLPQELTACSSFLDRELAGLKNVKVVVALGKIGFEAYLNHLKRRGVLASKKDYIFRHGASYELPDGKLLLASYHPSNQNTQTGKLTRKMFVEIFQEAARIGDR